MLNDAPPPLSEKEAAKLPKWAQAHVHRLERRNAEQATLIDEMRAARPNPIAVRDKYRDAVPVAWGQYDEISFVLAGTLDDEPRASVISVRRREEGAVEIRTPDGTLQITAGSSNVMTVAVIDPFRAAR